MRMKSHEFHAIDRQVSYYLKIIFLQSDVLNTNMVADPKRETLGLILCYILFYKLDILGYCSVLSSKDFTD